MRSNTRERFSIHGHVCLALLFFGSQLSASFALAQTEEDPGTGLQSAYAGLRDYSGVDRYGADAVDLQHLGLTVRQELSQEFQANGLPYQAIAYYRGTGWSDLPQSFPPDVWFSPHTVSGPLGAGWNVHMGKLLSTGREWSGFSPECTQVPLCDTYDPTLERFVGRNVVNTVLDPGGTLHPLGEACGPAMSKDFGWLQVQAGDLDEGVCQGVVRWKTPDGTLYEINQDRLVTSITDLSGNRIEIEYWDPSAMAQIRDCGPGGSFCDYHLPAAWYEDTGYGSNLERTFEVMTPIRWIRDSNGRRIDFVLTAERYGGKYRIGEVRSLAPNGSAAVYRLSYEERNVTNYVYAVPPEFWGTATPRTPCGTWGTCLAPEQDGATVNQVIENVAFLVKVERPDGLTVEYDYHTWGDLKSTRTIHGGVVKYTWGFWRRPNREGGFEISGQPVDITRTGVKLLGREVRGRPDEMPSGVYAWRFEKNFLPEFFQWPNRVPDQNRTVVITPEGNEIAYRFSDFGGIRNIKFYAGKAFRWFQPTSTLSYANPSYITSPAEGRLIREINRWYDQGPVLDASAYPIVSNVEGQEGPTAPWSHMMISTPLCANMGETRTPPSLV